MTVPPNRGRGAVARFLTRLSREPAAREGQMSPIHETEQARPQYRRLLRGPMIVLALVIIVRFVLEAAGVSLDTTRFLSASVVSGLAMVYVGAVAPLRGVTKFRQLALPALVLSAWLGGWTALALTISGVFRLPGSHFAHAPPSPSIPILGSTSSSILR